MEFLNDFFLPPIKSTFAGEVDGLFNFIHLVSFILLGGITVCIIYFCYKYRRKSDHDVTPVITHNNKLEVTWSVIPLIMVLIVFGWGFRGYMDMYNPPDDAYEIGVSAQMWSWQFRYENGASSGDELRVPVNRPIKLVMQSQDVIHSFYVPDYRVKHDVLPGRYTQVWFEATETGESTIFCTEYCGTNHSDMLAEVIAMEPDDFEDWLDENEGGGSQPDDLSVEEWGEQLVEQNGCLTCHSPDNSEDLQGPGWQGLFGSERTLDDGSTEEADENYIRESILEPNAKIVEGYNPVMPSYQGTINDEQMDAIIEYFKTLD